MDLNLIFTSFTEFKTNSGIESLFIRSGYKVCLSDIQQNIQDNQDYNKVLVVSLQTSTNHINRLKSLLNKKSENIPCFCIFHCDKGELNANLLQSCCDFVVWPCPPSELFFRLHGLVKKVDWVEDTRLQNKFHNTMIGESDTFHKVLKRIELFSQCDAPVMIEGETGTGKEMIARAVHYQSARRSHPFIPVNCGALPESLVENEFFGHHKGAYTDATANTKGLIAQAEGGTLFLDEMESLSLKGQVALLRLLQEQEYKPLGASAPIKANIRVVTATNIPLKSLVEQEVIRQDLFYRLNILFVEIPPLRNRSNDALLLADYFLRKYQQLYQSPEKELSMGSKTMIKNHDWPGNVRELENMIHRAFLISRQDTIHTSDFEYDNSFPSQENSLQFISDRCLFDVSFNEAKSSVIDEFEKHYLSSLMVQFRGNVTLAAKKACKERRALGKLLKKHGIERLNFVR